ncbi:hypothetical protein PHLCEN_2v5671 [Hermanssonia centrifuga]|uniref:Protein kinase domain-containing protein n=1 Tax=Hermanssonia centrifuga TaxID=98765 RepID=A0A2R6P1S1_9APHY|nr:hypothetical protein PHLCEN_2v5671 [Hermanssonia centrifuga]
MVDAATESSQAESEGPEGSDKPPHRGPSANKLSSHQDKPSKNGTQQTHTSPSTTAPTASVSATRPYTESPSNSIPLPPPEFHSFPKAPGRTRTDLQHLELGNMASNGVTRMKQQASSSTSGSITPPTSESPSPSECESWSVPSTQPPSRAGSFSTGKSGGKLEPMTAVVPPKTPSKNGKDSSKTPTATKVTPTLSKDSTASRSKGSGSRPPSVHSDGGGQKFTLKDLLGTPKLARRSSARSTSSKKSDSDRGGKSVAGESTTSLLKKYGVCEKVAIGKGATSVVRLAHKWDRSEEKLYAVKEFRKRRKNETEKEYVKKLTAEFCISSTLHHTNIVETVDLVQDENMHWCEVMEFCPGGDLYAAIKRGGMSPSEVECCFKQILTGVHYLHSQGVAHRDIKPENLFFDTKGHLKVRHTAETIQ